MVPVTHLFASWLIAAKTTDNLRDRRLVTLSGILPDLDGTGILVDFARQAGGHDEGFFFYQKYHHWLLHGAFGAAVISLALVGFARRRYRVACLSLLVVHLHLLCDLLGSRGPSPQDLWPIFYLAPFSKAWTWSWRYQWALDAWPNRILSVFLLLACLHWALRQGDSVVGVFNRRADRVFIAVLQKWRERWRHRGRERPTFD